MSRKGNCWDNSVLKSFFSSLKRELNRSEEYATIVSSLKSSDLNLSKLGRKVIGNISNPECFVENRFVECFVDQSHIMSRAVTSFRNDILYKVEAVYVVPYTFRYETSCKLPEYKDKYEQMYRINNISIDNRVKCSDILCDYWSKNLKSDMLENLIIVKNCLVDYEIITTVLMDPVVASILTVPIFIGSIKVLHSKGFHINIIERVIMNIERRGSLVSMTKKYILPLAIGTSSGLIAIMGMRSYLYSECPTNPYKFSGFTGDVVKHIQNFGIKIVYNVIDTVSKIRSAGLQAIIDSVSDMLCDNVKKIKFRLKD